MAQTTNRAHALLLILLALILVYRAVDLFASGAPEVWRAWVTALLWVEVGLLAATMSVAVAWLRRPGSQWPLRALQITTAVVVVHALRVAVFALGRTGPWVDFDVRPGYRADHSDRWTWFDVCFASGMAAVSLAVIAAIWIWRWRRSA